MITPPARDGSFLSWRTASVAVALAAAYGAAFAQPHVLKPRAGIEAICISEPWGRPRCIRVSELRRMLSPAAVQKILDRIDEIYRRLGLAPDQSALVSCGQASWDGVEVSEPFPPEALKGKLSSPELSGLQKHLESCRSGPTRARLPRLQHEGQYQSWVDQTVAQVEKDLGECRSSGNSIIAETPEERHRKTVGVMDIREKPPPTATKDQGVAGSMLFVKGSGSGTAPAQGWGEAETEDDTEEGEAETPASTAPSCRCSGVPRKTGQPCPEGGACRPTCEQMQARWQMFKEYCEQSDWQAYACADFLRKVRGCADLSLINPGPEGEPTCPGWARDDSEEQWKRAWVENCERRKWFINPLPEGDAVCYRPDVAVPTRIDVCNDPRAMPLPDQCPGRGTVPAGVGPRPSPGPDPSRPPGPL